MVSNSFSNRSKTAIFLVVVGVSSLILAVESVRILVATRISESKDIVQLRRAVDLDPANPELHYQLGTAEMASFESPDPAEGVRQLQRATELSPRQRRYWRALASACQVEGDKLCAIRAISRSLALSPMTPNIHWEAANYYLWANDQEKAIGQFRRLLELNTTHAAQIFQACLRVTGNPEIVYREVLPPGAGPGLKLRYVDFLAGHGHEDFAFSVWKQTVASRVQFNFSLAESYLNHLITSRQYQQAAEVWVDMEQRGIVKQSAGHDPSNIIFNGGFEQLPLDAGFDWRSQQMPYVDIDFRDGHPHHGTHCLRLDFTDVENHEDEPVYQIVPVKPGQDYTLTCYVRSANISSGSGPMLRVTDPDCPSCLSKSSDPVLGTTAWHEISLSFQTGPQTGLVRVSVWRPRSLDYPTGILGTLWLDEVSMRAINRDSDQPTERTGI